MKSAYELALERSGGILNRVSDEVKQKLAEIAEAELSAQQRLAREEDPAKIEEIKSGLITEIASINDRCEHEKEKVRNRS